MSIDPSEARKVAHLARIAVADDALPALAAELNGILHFMEQLNEVDVEGVRALRWHAARVPRRIEARGEMPFLHVFSHNSSAIALYRREGFEIVGTRKKYYQPSGADAYTMRRPAVLGVREIEEQQA